MQALILCVLIASAAASLPFTRLDDLAAAVRAEANLGAEIKPFNLTVRDGTKVRHDCCHQRTSHGNTDWRWYARQPLCTKCPVATPGKPVAAHLIR